MSKYIPYPFFHDDVPIDISFVFENEKPAGKHGFLKTEGKHFVFEDGTKVRFWGTNFNGGGNFPEHSYAEKLAKRLAKTGINLVRFHQLDSEWNTPNIFAFTKGRRFSGSSFDPESLDRLDYLIYCLKKEGIYCYMDMFTYRKFRSDEGVENAAELPDAAKPYCIYNERLIELQKDLCTRLWTHHNPYTNLAYCDDPVFVLAEIVNECHLYSNRIPITAEPYKTEFINKFDNWLKENGYSENGADFDISDNNNETVVKFKIYLEEKYYKEMMEHMRSCGVKIPINGTNMMQVPPCLKANLTTDFLDVHPYFYDWKWGEFEKRCKNESITQRAIPFLSNMAMATVKDKPTYISEWDMPWPNEYRAESPIYCAAMGLLQDWSGFAIHTYSYSSNLDRMDILGKEISAEKIGNIPYRQGIFSAWNDPAKFGLFYHAALMTRRGDVSPSKKIVKQNHVSLFSYDFNVSCANFNISRVEVDDKFESFTGEPTELQLPPESTSDTGELYINKKTNYGYVDTDMTKCLYGFLLKNGAKNLSGVKIDCKTDFAVIAMSSLTDKVITESDNILLTTVGRAKNTDSKFEGELMYDIGKAPVCVEVIEADVEIETNVEGLVVWAISAEGFYIGTVPTSYKDGKLKFKVGEISQSMYYLIVKE